MSKKLKLDKRLLLVFIMFIFVGTVLFVSGILLYIDHINFTRSAVQAEGVITDIVRYRKPNQDSDTHEVYVAFTADGVEYEDCINEWNSKMHIGQEINILYNPDNPRDFRTETFLLPLIFIPLGLLCMLVGAIPVTIMHRRYVARKKLLESGRKVMAEITDVVGAPYRFNRHQGRCIICERFDETTGTLYRYKSAVIWADPTNIIMRRNITELPVYLDGNNERNYYVDISQLFENMKDFT